MILNRTNKTLFLLTKAYPFGTGEQYISDELCYLSKKFRKIFIYPNDYYGNIKDHDKMLPNNVEILNLNNLLSQQKVKNALSDYFFLLKHTVLEGILTDDKKNYLNNFKWNLINFWTQYKLSKLFLNYLSSNNYNSTNSVFYSYWFHKGALLLSVLKNKSSIDKFFSRAHSIDLYHQSWGLINKDTKVPPFKMFKLKNVTKIFTISKHGADYLSNKYPEFSDKIIVQRLGVNMPSLTKNYKPHEAFHIITCSGTDEFRRIHCLADALAEIKHKVIWTHFGLGELTDLIKNKVENFPKNIEARLMGFVPNKMVKQFYSENKIDLLVNLSRVEGIPVSIMEAMACKITILATEVYGTPEAVIENKNGFLLSANFTQEELISKLNYCIENKKLLGQMGESSYNMYLERFNAEKNYSEFANYLESL